MKAVTVNKWMYQVEKGGKQIDLTEGGKAIHWKLCKCQGFDYLN